MAGRKKKTWLWRIEGSGLDKPSWLLGTIHLADRRVLRFPRPVRQALDQCDLFCSEARPDDFLKPEIIAEYRVAPGEPSPVPARLLQAAMDVVPARVPVGRLKTWAVALMVIGADAERAAASRAVKERTRRSRPRPAGPVASPMVCMDVHLHELMAREGKLGAPVETALEQVRIYDRMPQRDQRRMLRDLLANASGSSATRTGDLAQNYVDVDVVSLRANMARQAAGGGPGARFMARIFGRRDRLMADRIARLLTERPGTSFLFALGAGHLAGRDGVVDRLRDRFDVRQVTA